MKILIISPVLPYRNVRHGGGAILFSLMEALARRNDVALAAMREPFEKEKVEELKSLVEVVVDFPRRETSEESLAALANGGFASKARLWARGFLNDAFSVPTPDVKAFSDLVLAHLSERRYDVAQVEFPQWLSYFVKKIRAPIVVGAAHDVVFKAYDRMRVQKKNVAHRALATLRYALEKRNELATYRRLTRVYALSDFDKNLLLRAEPTLKAETRRAGFSPPAISSDATRERNMILFVGYLARGENQDGARFMIDDVMPLVWKTIPDAQLHVVGGGAPRWLLEKGDGRTIFFHGYQENLRAFYERARVMTAPLFVGGGIITKLIESLMNGLPAVSTSVGNEGVQAPPNEAILIADSAEAFAQAIARLIQDDELHRRMSEAARRHFEQNFRIERVAESLEESYRRILSEHAMG
ncbi:MAG: glycosyltransferase family 4 protein [Chloroherpetonaceae bacterium]|nr:glycosyltransferase family 4 protein [Chloroherpetonaceae bacterium]MDW8438222.1 glycosyltransferase family 4 protein [Chloroherpetonaceae bacterium]